MAASPPMTAAEFFSIKPISPSPTSSPWPPHEWFETDGVFGDDGQPFDWSPPPAGFGPREARAWVDRVLLMYRRYHYAEGVSPAFWGNSRQSILNNAQLLVEDLSRRGATRSYSIRMIRGQLDELDGDQELERLGIVRDWLEKEVRLAERQQPNEEDRGTRVTRAPRIRTEWQRGVVILDGREIEEAEIACLFIEAMIQTRERTSLAKIDQKMQALARVAGRTPYIEFLKRHDRYKGKIHDRVLKGIIESDTGKGTCIKPEYLE